MTSILMEITPLLQTNYLFKFTKKKEILSRKILSAKFFFMNNKLLYQFEIRLPSYLRAALFLKIIDNATAKTLIRPLQNQLGVTSLEV